MISANMLNLPFPEGCFDKAVSVTALEFIEDAKEAVGELFRVTKERGTIVVATLNSLSSWASRRIAEAKQGHAIFEKAIFRSTDELRSLASAESVVKTAIHFGKDEDPEKAVRIEQEGKKRDLKTGAFVAVRWVKP
jgi:ubiquinone/menaquinone biosynthesis C-methylase UbiE